MNIRQRWQSVRDWSARAWANIRPGPETRKGTIWGAVALAIAISNGMYLKLGYGRAFDVTFALLIAALGVPMVALLVVLLMTILRRLPRFATGMAVGALALAMLAFSPDLGSLFGGLLLLTECVLGATVATLLAGHFREAHISKRILTVVLLAGAVAANIALLIFLSGTGTDKD